MRGGRRGGVLTLAATPPANRGQLSRRVGGQAGDSRRDLAAVRQAV